MSITLPNIGDKVILLPGNYGQTDSNEWWGVPEYYRDKVGTVHRIDSPDSTSPIVRVEYQSHQKPDDTISYGSYNWKPADGHTLTVSDPDTRDSLIKDEEIARLRTEIDRLEELATSREQTIQRLNTSVTNWTNDFQTYAERIMQEAIERGWCDTYESVMEDIQSRLTVAVIPEREQEYEVEVEITGEASITRTLYVMARSQEDADELVADDISSYIDVEEALSEQVRYNGWDSTDASVQ